MPAEIRTSEAWGERIAFRTYPDELPSIATLSLKSGIHEFDATRTGIQIILINFSEAYRKKCWFAHGSIVSMPSNVVDIPFALDWTTIGFTLGVIVVKPTTTPGAIITVGWLAIGI